VGHAHRYGIACVSFPLFRLIEQRRAPLPRTGGPHRGPRQAGLVARDFGLADRNRGRTKQQAVQAAVLATPAISLTLRAVGVTLPSGGRRNLIPISPGHAKCNAQLLSQHDFSRAIDNLKLALLKISLSLRALGASRGPADLLASRADAPGHCDPLRVDRIPLLDCSAEISAPTTFASLLAGDTVPCSVETGCYKVPGHLCIA
jgi:hypothetical protein